MPEIGVMSQFESRDWEHQLAVPLTQECRGPYTSRGGLPMVAFGGDRPREPALESLPPIPRTDTTEEAGL